MIESYHMMSIESLSISLSFCQRVIRSSMVAIMSPDKVHIVFPLEHLIKMASYTLKRITVNVLISLLLESKSNLLEPKLYLPISPEVVLQLLHRILLD